jgi:hypothetical protein
MSNGFDPTNYHCQRYSIHGFAQPQRRGECNGRILKEEIKEPWPSQGEILTLKTLLERRKKELWPHPSFDLDGDGGVSARELFLAMRFDKDQDGMLNAQEKQELMDALHNGLEKKYTFLDGKGSNECNDPASLRLRLEQRDLQKPRCKTAVKSRSR